MDAFNNGYSEAASVYSKSNNWIGWGSSDHWELLYHTPRNTYIVLHVSAIYALLATYLWLRIPFSPKLIGSHKAWNNVFFPDSALDEELYVLLYDSMDEILLNYLLGPIRCHKTLLHQVFIRHADTINSIAVEKPLHSDLTCFSLILDFTIQRSRSVTSLSIIRFALFIFTMQTVMW